MYVCVCVREMLDSRRAGRGGPHAVIGKYRRRARANLMIGLRYRGEGGVCEKKKKSKTKAGASARAPLPFLLSLLCLKLSYLTYQ